MKQEQSEWTVSRSPAWTEVSFRRSETALHPDHTTLPVKTTSLDAHLALTFWHTLLESLHHGVLIVRPTLDSQNATLMYANSKAKALYPLVQDPDEPIDRLPRRIAIACRKFHHDANSEPLVVEYRGQHGNVLRSRMRWLYLNESFDNGDESPYIFATLEDIAEVLNERLLLEKQKYQLTDRETDVWRLLRQGYTYQEVSDRLVISLNTVKTHARNVHAKQRRNDEPLLWYSR